MLAFSDTALPSIGKNTIKFRRAFWGCLEKCKTKLFVVDDAVTVMLNYTLLEGIWFVNRCASTDRQANISVLVHQGNVRNLSNKKKAV
jgi:hypothetical protein